MRKIKINYRKDLFRGHNGLCESVFCAPFEDPNKFKEDNYENNRFNDLISNGHKYLEYTSIEDCDYVVIPYKWDGRTDQNLNIISNAKKFNKKAIALYNDDNSPNGYLNIDEGFIFNTTINRSSRVKNEFPFPAFTGDFFAGNYIINKKIGFCGAITSQLRQYVLSVLSLSKKLNIDFLVRKSFWATSEMSKDEARIGYMENMEKNSFILCVRGAGNFSYRLYETMMMGRIPIIIDSDQVFPFENIIDYSKFSIKIELSELNDIEGIIYNKIYALSENQILSMQKTSRETWVEYMSPLGWIKNFRKEL